MRTYADVMREQQLARERDATLRALADRHKETAEAAELARRTAALDAAKPTKSSGLPAPAQPAPSASASEAGSAVGEKRRNRWDTAPKCVARATQLRLRPGARRCGVATRACLRLLRSRQP